MDIIEKLCDVTVYDQDVATILRLAENAEIIDREQVIRLCERYGIDPSMV